MKSSWGLLDQPKALLSSSSSKAGLNTMLLLSAQAAAICSGVAVTLATLRLKRAADAEGGSVMAVEEE